MEALLALAARRLGNQAWRVITTPAAGPLRTGWWEPAGPGLIRVGGGSLLAASRALAEALAAGCGALFSWEGDRLGAWQDPAPGRRMLTSPYQHGHYLNQVTYAYSTPFWDWPRWEREIDLMALAGIDLPLMALGQEALWRDTWRAFGLDAAEVATYWTGPAYLPFNRMGCLDGYDGPLPAAWIDQQEALARRVLARMRELDMTPVLPAFSGHVPAALAQRQPQARIRTLGDWCGFTPTCFLDPGDALFDAIQQTFLGLLRDRWGTDHRYAADPFIETTPPSDCLLYTSPSPRDH
jgi:hypothetical protein